MRKKLKHSWREAYLRLTRKRSSRAKAKQEISDSLESLRVHMATERAAAFLAGYRTGYEACYRTIIENQSGATPSSWTH